MFAVYLVCLLAAASAAPHYQWDRHHPSHYESRDTNFFRGYLADEDLLDTNRMWRELNDEIAKIEDALNDFARTYPHIRPSTEGYVDGKYKITIPLSGFSEKAIVVKAGHGLLMVQATQQTAAGNIRKSYLNMRNLPTNVNPSGSWSFENDVLTIIFPLVSTETSTDEVETTQTPQTTTEVVTSPRDTESREEMAPVDKTDNIDADVGVVRGDNFKDDGESSTYAVDNTNEIDFVPVQYRVLNK